MNPTQFNYAAPNSLDEAVEMLRKNQGAKILAGGQILLPEMKLRHVFPSMLVDLRKIRSLRGISYCKDGCLRIGAMDTYTEIAAHQDIREKYHALSEAVNSIGDLQVRNAGTIGGNLASRTPTAELPAVALALEFTINTIGSNGIRAIAADQFFVDSCETVLEQGEIITSVDLPPHTNGTGSAYEKVKNPVNLSSICSVAAKIVRLANGKMSKCCVAVTGATDCPRRLRAVETMLESRELTADNITAAALQASEEFAFRRDLYASAEYRAYLTKVFTEKVLTSATKRSGIPV